MKVNMTKTQAETALSSFVANGWLYKSEYVPYHFFWSVLMIISDEGDMGYHHVHLLNWSYIFAVPTKMKSPNAHNAKNSVHWELPVTTTTQTVEQSSTSTVTNSINELPTNAPTQNVMRIGPLQERLGRSGKVQFRIILMIQGKGRFRGGIRMLKKKKRMSSWKEWTNPMVHLHRLLRRQRKGSWSRSRS